jgi:hypothetical protein
MDNRPSGLIPSVRTRLGRETRFKKLVVDLSLDKQNECGYRKKRMKLVGQSDASWLRVKYAASERRVSVLMTVSSYRYWITPCDDELRTCLVELAGESLRCGYRWLHVLLLWAGEALNLGKQRAMKKTLAKKRQDWKTLKRAFSTFPQLRLLPLRVTKFS